MDSIDKLLAESLQQNTDLWDKIRLGRFTASEMHKLMSEPKSAADRAAGKLSDGAMTYVYTKVAETLTGEAPEISTYEMQWGHEHEPYARKAFEKATGFELESVGFIRYTEHSGGSPDDKVVNPRAIVDYKCPANSVNHIKHMMIDSPEYFKANHKEYYYQLQANMLFADCELSFFVSYDHRFSECPLFIFEMEANKADQQAIKQAIERATAEKKRIINLIKSKSK